jgi:hypothetical protein
MTTICSPHDVGGKTQIPVPGWMRSTAVFGGANQEYRYTLSRTWDDSLPSVLFLLMNPSTASIKTNDPTVAKCCRYAMAWGYGSLWIGNSCAYRATDQKRLITAPDPIGPENDKYLVEMADQAALIVMAYGKPHESLRYRGLEVAMLISHGGTRALHTLKLCKDGTPSHPLYLKGDLRPTVWRTAEDTSAPVASVLLPAFVPPTMQVRMFNA